MPLETVRRYLAEGYPRMCSPRARSATESTSTLDDDSRSACIVESECPCVSCVRLEAEKKEQAARYEAEKKEWRELFGWLRKLSLDREMAVLRRLWLHEEMNTRLRSRADEMYETQVYFYGQVVEADRVLHQYVSVDSEMALLLRLRSYEEMNTRLLAELKGAQEMQAYLYGQFVEGDRALREYLRASSLPDVGSSFQRYLADVAGAAA